MTAATIPHKVTLSIEGERTFLFWSAPPDALLLDDIVCAATGLAKNTLCNMRASGDGPGFVRRGHRIWYRQGDVVDWMRANAELRSDE